MDSPSQPSGIPNGFLQAQATWGDYNNILSAVIAATTLMQTAMPVQIMACTNSGGLSAVGFVDVLPLVNQIDGQGKPTPHETIYGIPYLRIQGGASAIILDPVPGDIGICVFASRDISKVKATKAQANPGSWRTFDFSDGMYLGGILNGVPSQYIQFSAAGIGITSPTAVTLAAPTVAINAPTVNITATSSLNLSAPTVKINGVDFTSHIHSNVTHGTDDTGPPV